MGWSLVTTRSVFEHRAVLVGADREHLMTELALLAAGETGAGAVVGRARPVGKTVFVFPGQGSQRLGMGQQLYGRFPVFVQAFDEAVAALDPHLRLPLRQVIWGSDPAALAKHGVRAAGVVCRRGGVGRRCCGTGVWCRTS